MHGNTISHLNFPQLLHQLIGAARNKPRRQNRFRVHKPILDGVDPAEGGVSGAFGAFLGQRLAGFAVHIDLTDVADQAAFLHQLHQQLGCEAMARGENTSARRRAFLQGIDKQPVRLAGIGKILVLFFLREGIPIQPIHQLQIHTHSAKRILRRVDVQIHHSGEDQPIAIVVQRQGGVFFGQHRKHAPRDAVHTNHIRLFAQVERVGCRGLTDVALYHKAVHSALLFRLVRSVVYRKTAIGFKQPETLKPIAGI